MKYIIILLTSLFLVSTASANKIKSMCEDLESLIPNKYESYMDTNTPQRNADIIRELLIEDAKLYHYLDCKEELGR